MKDDGKIFANISVLNYKQLKDVYKAVDIDGIIEKKVKYYRLKPFQSRTKEIWIEKIKDWLQLVNTDFPEEEAKPKKSKSKYTHFDTLTRRGQIESFWNIHPFFYDKSQIFWLWNDEEKKWELSDEVDFLNSIQETLGVETIDGKARGEFIAGFKQVGRKHKPEPMKNSWVQFKDIIYDLETDESFQATPDYFVKNPIPWNIGESEETPIMDELFGEWVEEKYIKTLYEIIASSTSHNKFMQRMIALVGGGSNGKGTFVQVMYKFLGEDNCVSSELKILSENQFETAVIYGKLLVVFGEVSHNDLKNTNTIKQLAGEDKMRFCFKGKTPFTDHNSALGICLTNSLPITPDRTRGFYRKWLIIDFPNQFTQIKKNLIEKIPEEEFENLAKKCLRILKELYKNSSYTNEGDFEERERRYEERSNPIMRFVESHFEEIDGNYIPIREFTNKCNLYLKSKHLRVQTAIQIGKTLRNEGFGVSQRKIDNVTQVVILNLKSKGKPLKLLEPLESPVESYKGASENLGGLGSSSSFSKEELEQAHPDLKKFIQENTKKSYK